MDNADVYATDGVAVTWAAAMNAGHGYRTKIALAIYIYIYKEVSASFFLNKEMRTFCPTKDSFGRYLHCSDAYTFWAASHLNMSCTLQLTVCR